MKRYDNLSDRLPQTGSLQSNRGLVRHNLRRRKVRIITFYMSHTGLMLNQNSDDAPMRTTLTWWASLAVRRQSGNMMLMDYLR